MARPIEQVAIAALIANAVGCAPSRAEVFRPVAAAVSARLGHDVKWRSPMMSDDRVREAVRGMLADGLTADEAVRIGLLNNRRLQAAFDELGVASGELAEASVLRDPEIEASVRFSGGGDPAIEVDAVQDVLDLVVLGRRRGVASAGLEAARRDAIAAVIDRVAEVRSAYYRAQAAEQRLEMRQAILVATDAAYTLARRLREAGNINELELLRERDLFEEARIDLVEAKAERALRRQELDAVLGLWGQETDWRIAGRLDAPPKEPIELTHFERLAVERSLELEAERFRLQASGGRVGLARLGRWLPELGVGVSAEREAESGEWGVGPAVVLSVPLWSAPGGGAVIRREAELSRQQQRYTALAIEVRSRARSTRERLRAARARVEAYRDTLLPLRAEIVEQTELQRNAMAASSFELFAAKRRQIEAGAAYLDALLDYWLARVAADQTLAGGRPGEATGAAGRAGGPRPMTTGGHE